MNAHEIAIKLGGAAKSGDGWMCRCPAHADNNASLFIWDAGGKVCNFCHAHCDAETVNQFFQQQNWLTVLERHKHSYEVKVIEPSKFALEIWDKSIPALGTPVELYLSNRGFDGEIPETIRYQRLKHPDGGEYDCMVSAVMHYPSPEVYAVHRTFLQDGSKAPIERVKMMLGPVKGGAIRLAEYTDKLGICEGIETGLTCMQHFGLPVWAAMSAGGMENLVVPHGVQHVIIFADNDENGTGEKSAIKTAHRLHRSGHVVEVRMPPEKGMDYNDYFHAKVA